MRPVHVGILSPDEYALHIDVDDGALAFADGLTRYADSLGFFPDGLLGEDPRKIKEGLKRRFGTLLGCRFEHLLFAHGDPIVGHGRTALVTAVAEASPSSPWAAGRFGSSAPSAEGLGWTNDWSAVRDLNSSAVRVDC